MKPSTLRLAADWLLRVALSAAFLSAVADRLGLCGPPGSSPNIAWGAWAPFVDYTGTLLFFLPKSLVSPAALAATAGEIVLGLWLLTGWQTRLAAWGSAALLLSFGATMTLALGVKAPLNYSVFTGVAAAVALAALQQSSEES